MLDQDAEYFIASKLYKEAADNYIRILQELPDNANLQFRIGYSFLNADGFTHEAISYLEKASDNVSMDITRGSLREVSAPPEAILLLGFAYQQNNQFEKAKEAYKRFREIIPEGDERELIADQYLQSIDHALDFMDKPLQVDKVNLGRNINSSYANLNAVVSGDGQTMVFTRISGSGFDVFVVRRRGDQWGRPVNISSQLRRDFLMSTDLSYDGSVLYLIYYLPDRSDIYTSEFEDGEWGRARSIGRRVNSRNNETHASVSSDGTTLYFTSDRDGGYGGLDIYQAKLDSRGRWRDVENIGPEINTPFNEDTPFITNDNRYLFFSSEGHNSMGGYDVFYVDMDDHSRVHNLGYPVNTTGDDIFYFPVDEGRTGYISYHDENGIGSKDIFRVTIKEPDIIYADDPEDEHLPEKDAAEPEAEGLTVGEYDSLFPGHPEGVREHFFVAKETEIKEKTEVTEDHHIFAESETIAELPSPTLPVHTTEGRSYSIQILALLEPLSSEQVESMPGIIIHFDNDGFSRIITGYYRTEEEALPVLMHYRENGYPDAFIRINNYIPNYTIQVKAMNNFLDRNFFNDLEEFVCIKGADGLYRYSFGYYSKRADLEDQANKLRDMGYEDLFINSVDW